MVILFRIVLLATALVLLATPVLAADIIHDVRFSGTAVSQAGERTYVLANREVPARMQFTLNESYSSAFIDISSFNTRPRQQIFVDASECSSRRCDVPVLLNVTVTASQTYKDLSFVATEVSGQEHQLTQRFYIDNTRPRVVGIGTPYCTQSCSLKSGANIISVYFEERESGIDAASVFMMFNGQSIRASQCSSEQCNFSVSIPASATQAAVQLTAAQDRAGNSAASLAETIFTIDNDAPAVSTVTLQPSRPVITGPFELHISVDDASPVQLRADIGEFTTGTRGANITTINCGMSQTCVIPIRPTRAGSYEATVFVTVSDSAGNSEEFNRTFTVARRVAEEGDFWEVGGTLQPNKLDKGSIKNFKKNFYMELELSQQGDAELGYVQAATCALSNGDSGVDVRPVDVKILDETSSRPVLMFTIPPTEARLDDRSGNLDVECLVRTYSIVDGGLYDNPEEDRVRGTIQIVSTPLIPERLAELQKNTQTDLNEDLQQLQQMKQLYTLADTLCSTSEDIRSVAAALTLLQMSLSVTPGGDGAAVQMMMTSNAMNEAADKLANSEVGAKLCQAVSCQDPFGSQSYATMLTAPGISKETLDTIAGYTTLSPDSDQAFFDPYRSQYIAWMTGCVPAIIYHEETQSQIQCQYNSCLQQDVATGLPVSICAEQRSDANCRYVTSGVLNMVPYTTMASTITNNFVNVITNPVSLTGAGLTLVCNANTGTRLNALCKIPKTVDSLSRTHSLYEKVRTTINTARSGSEENLCNSPRLPRQDLLDRLPDGYRCGTNHCCVDGYCKIGDDYYKQLSKSEVAEADDIAQNDDQQIYAMLEGTTLLHIDEDDVPSRTTDNMDQLFSAFGLEPASFEDSIGDMDGLMRDIERDAAAAAAVRDEAKHYDEERQNIKELRQHAQRFRSGTSTVDPRSEYLSRASLTTQALERERTNLQRNWGGVLEQRDGETEAQYTARRQSRRVFERYQQDIDERLDVLREAEAALQAIQEPDFPIELQGTAEHQRAIDDYKTDVFRAEQKLASALESANQAMAAGNTKLAKQIEEQNVQRIKDAQWEVESERFADPSYRARQGVRTALQLDRITSAFGFNKYFGDAYGNRVREVTGQLPSVDDAVNAVCEARSDIRESPHVMGFDENGQIGLYIYGAKALPIDDEFGTGEPQTVYYTVGGRMLIPRTDVTYSVVLQPGGHVLATEVVAAQGGGVFSKSWNGMNLLSHESLDQFTEVCVEFNRPLQELFAKTNAPDDTLCVDLEVIS